VFDQHEISFFHSFFLAGLGLELRAFTLSHSYQPYFCEEFFRDRVLWNYMTRVALNYDLPAL
jgi:hypothetical protein